MRLVGGYEPRAWSCYEDSFAAPISDIFPEGYLDSDLGVTPSI